MSVTDISELDFLAYKNELINFLQTQSQFKDYDYTGSNLSVLLDVLSYNTFQNAYYNNMVFSEMFLDSAKLRTSVASHAKALNYTPRSKISASATVKITLDVNDSSPFVTVPKRTKFTSPTVNSKYYSFYNHESFTIIPSDGVYVSDNIEIYEGVLTNEKYFAKADENIFYRISNKDVDTNTLRVYITNADGVETEYELADSLYGLTSDSKVYFIQYTGDYYEIYFGRNMFGKQPKKDFIIRLEYLISKGEDGNGVTEFYRSNSKINGYDVVAIETVSKSYGGADNESLQSIKFYAPKAIQVQDRAVTESDYKILLKNNFPEVQSVSVVGGEKMTPPQFGKVFVYVDTVNANGLSAMSKYRIEQFLLKRTPLGIETKIMTPSFFFLEVNSEVQFNNKNTNKSNADIIDLVTTSIKEYSNKYLNSFDADLSYSKLITAIDETDTDIISNQTNTRIFCEKDVKEGVRNDFVVDFGNELTPIADYAIRSLQSLVPNHPYIPKLDAERADRLPTVSSSVFRYKGNLVYMRDNGFGVMQIIQNTNDVDVILNKNVGSVDYKTGYVKIVNFIPNSLLDTFKLYATTKNKNINCPKGSILAIRKQDLNIKIIV